MKRDEVLDRIAGVADRTPIGRYVERARAKVGGAAAADPGVRPRRILWQTALVVILIWRLERLFERERS